MNLINIQDGQAVTTSRQVAESFTKDHHHVLRDIENILGGISKIGDTPVMFHKSDYEHPQNHQLYHEYVMNRDGFTLLAMGFTGADAMQWKIKYIQAFNEMEKQLSAPQQMSQLQIIAAIAQAAADQEAQLKQLSTELQGIRDVVTLNTTNWRKDVARLITKIADKLGGFEHIQPTRATSYKNLEERINVDLKRRVTNKRLRMAEEGVCKSKRDKVNALDIIGDDKKLLETYMAVIKDMAIKAGVA